MALTNAVLVRHKTGMTWVIDSASIAEWGRIESFLSVGDIDDPVLIAQIGAEHLATRAAPKETNTVEVIPVDLTDLPGYAFGVGDTLEDPFGDTPRCVGIEYQMDEQVGTLRTPELRSRGDESVNRSGLAMARLINQAGGGSGASSTPIDLGTTIPVGKLGEISVPPWSWNSTTNLLGDMQPWPADRPMRLYEWEINADSSTATGDTVIKWIVNGADPPVPFIITLGSSDDFGSQAIFGAAFLKFGDLLQPVVLEVGGHTKGSIAFRASDPA